MTTKNTVVQALILVAGLAGPVRGQTGPSPAQVLDIAPGVASSNPRSMVVMGGVAYFAATDPEHGIELWRSDGSAAGTYMVVDIRPGPASSDPGNLWQNSQSAQAKLEVMDDHLYFVADDGVYGQELWRSDGTAGGTELVVDAVPGSEGARPHHLTAVGSTLFFAACEPSTGCELWKSDGTAAGTGLVADIRVGTQSSFPEHLAVLGDVVLFAANDNVVGEELWRSDGTASGTFLVKDIDPTPLVYPPDGFGRSYPQWLTRVGDAVLFIAEDATHGYELWRTDGTSAGTSMVVDLNPGSGDGAWSGGISTVQLVDGRLFFLGRTGSGSSYRGMVSDGTTEGTRATGSGAGADRARLGSFYYFIGYSADGAELWRADTEAGGGSQFANLAPGSSSSNPKFFETIGDRIFFTANGGAGLGEELWQSDGTVPGTLRMSDINPGSGSSSPSKVIRLGDQLLFTASDGTTGVELWSISLNRTPIARAGADVELFEGGTAPLDASASTDPDGDPMTYEWRDEADVILGTGQTLSLEGLANGVHQITLVVSDGTLSSTDTVQITLGNTRPLTIRVISVENGVGTLTVSSPASTCVGAAGSDTVCVVDAPFTATVTLTAEASGLSSFNGWQGGGCGYEPVCNLPMTSAKSVAPRFRGPRNVTINVVSAENGVGTVSGTYGTTPYSCSGVAGAAVSCSFEVKDAAPFTTTALPNSVSVLDSLTGCYWDQLFPNQPPCSPFPIYDHLTVTATFRRVVPTPVFEVRVASLENGGGDVMGSVYDATTGLDTPFLCAAVVGSTASCVVPANLGNTVSLYAMPQGLSVLHALTGCTVDPFSADGAGCYPPFTLTDDKTILATFRGPQTLTIEAVSFENGLGEVFASNGLGMNLSCPGVAGTTSTCTIPVRVGDSISFFAMPGPLSVLNSIDGCVADPFDPNGAGCFPPFAMTGPKTISATFQGPQTLTIEAVSFENGLGEVFASNGLGMNLSCQGVAGTTSTCTIPVRIGDSISFFAMPGPLSVLNSIAGCVADPFDPNGAGCFPPFSMTGPKTVSATFRGPQTLTIEAVSFENGLGEVFASNGLDMNLSCQSVTGTTSACTIPVRIGDSISFFAMPGPLSVLNSIAGCVADPFDPNGAGCFPPFAMTGPKTVSATFRGPKTVTVSFAGTGSGTVFGPMGACPSSGGTCVRPIPIGAFELAAMPASDSDFLAWTGACAGQGATCSVNVTDDFAVGVDFKLKNRRPVAVPGGLYARGRNMPITFNGAGSYDPDGDPLTYNWSFGDGTTGTGVAPVHTYTSEGTFPVRLTVSDGFLTSTEVTTTASITNTVPAANPGGPYNAYRLQPKTFNGSGSSDPNGDPLTYSWNLGPVGTATGVAPTRTYTTTGTFSIGLVVNDGYVSSAVASTTVVVRPTNFSPIANPGGPYAGVVGQSVTFNGAASIDPYGDPLTYIWNFGDGATGNGPTPSHSYATSGVFTVTLRVNDGVNNSSVVATYVAISNTAPTANAGGPYAGARNAPIAFAGSATDADNDTLTYFWDFGDGATGTGANVSHAYATLGNFTATLTTSDGAATSAPSSAAVTIGNRAPVVSLDGPYSGVRQQLIAFTATGSDEDGDAIIYSWDFGDGATAIGASVTHSYATVGTFAVVVTANDGLDSTPASSEVTIANQTPAANPGGPYSGIRNQAITFSGAASNDPDGDTLTYSWDFGDGSPAGSGAAPTHTYATMGTFTVTLTVNDGTVNSTAATATVTISNQAPTANAGGPYSGVRNQAVALSGAASNDPDGDPLTYSWDFGDGSPMGSGVAPTHAYATTGTFTVTLTVNDGTVNSTAVTATVTISNQTPTANAGGPYAGVRNQAITFSGTASNDPDGDTLTYSWDFGDGSAAGSGVAPTHAYATTGTFTVTLTVNDGTVNSTAGTATVTISNQAPTANAGGPYSAVRNQAVTFSAGASNDPDGDTLTYSWDFGDGSPAGAGIAPTHAYATTGTFTVALTVNDGTANSTAATATVTISNQAPTANAGGPYSGVRNQAVAFSGATSNDPDGDTLTFSWDFGDGSPAGSGVAPTHAYTTTGTFTMTLTVNDGTVNSTAATATVTISNQAPTANAGGPYAGVRNQAITFSGAASNDPDGDTLTYSWDFGDGSPAGSGVAPTHAYATTGTFTVTLTVNDGTVNSTAATATVTISNQAPTANAGGPYAGVRNQAITFSGAASNDPDGDTLTYSWDFGDGSPAGSGAAPTHAYATTGTFTVTLTVNDGTVNSTAATATVTISNQAPTANAGGPYAGTRLAAIGFNGAASTDPDGDALTYSWNFGDGGVATGPTPTHLYTATGTFTVTLTVNDGTTNSAPATSTVTITNVAPTVALTTPGSGAVFHAPAGVTVSASATDPDGGVAKVEFYAGAVKIGEALVAPYTILWPATVPGSYALTAVVTDSSGATVGSTPVNVIINAPPTVAITSPADNAQFAAPASITLTASAADGDGTIAQVQFFHGTTSLGIDNTAPYSVTWTGAPVGSYQLTAAATDNRGAMVTSAPITVKVTATLALTADSYVRASSSNSNFGTATELTVQQGSSNSNLRWTYVKFDLSAIPTVTNAKVRLFGRVSATTTTAINTAAYAVVDTSWTETGIKWSNKPATGTTALTTVAIVNNSTTARWYEFDVTAHLQAEKAAGRNVVTLAFKNLANSTPYVTFTSRQGTAANRPQVVVIP